MKKYLFLYAFLMTLGCVSQDPVFDLNSTNTVLINPSSPYLYHDINSTSIKIDSRFEYYNENKNYFTSNFNAYFSSEKNFSIGLNILYDDQNADNKIKSLAVFSTYHYSLKKESYISGGVSLGYNSIKSINNYSDLRFTDQKLFQSLNLEKNPIEIIDIEAGIRLFFNESDVGVSLTNCNVNKFPNDDAKKMFPQKLNAYFRKSVFRKRLYATIVSQNQRKTTLDEFNTLFDNFGYTGIYLDYMDYRIITGLFFKQIYNDASVYGITAGIIVDNFNITYTFSCIPKKINNLALFNQISLEYWIGPKPKSSLGGSIRFL